MERYNSINTYLKNEFGTKIVKLSLNGGFTCPNRDGKVGYGGCSFCSSSGSGDMASRLDSIDNQLSLLADKWPNVDKFLAYFQSYTSTYAPACELRRKYRQALSHPKVVGLVIGTRPDCLSDEILDLLEEYNKKTFLWIELGLQTIHENTAQKINRCYPLSTYDRAASELQKRNIKFVTHLILGLPGETEEMMIQSLDYVCSKSPFGLKLHLLNLVKNSPLAKSEPDYISFNSIDQYTDLVCNLITRIPENITIHRLTGDVPRKDLISPEWSYKKRTILNTINKKLSERNLYQGCNLEQKSSAQDKP